MEGHCSTGQSPQWAVVQMEEEEDEEEEEEEEKEEAFKPNVFLESNNNFTVFLLEYIGCWSQK